MFTGNPIELLQIFSDDMQTRGTCMIGELGDDSKKCAAEGIIKSKYPRPVLGFIAVWTALKREGMGYAGTVILGSKGLGRGQKHCL